MVTANTSPSELTPAEAARILGVHRNTIYLWIDCGILKGVRRPSPKRLLLSAQEVSELRRKTEDPEFWTSLRTQSASPSPST